MQAIEEYVEGLPHICGADDLVVKSMSKHRPVYLKKGDVAFDGVKSTFAVALHMQQPLIPAGSDDLRSAEIISNLKYMMDHQEIGDNHNAPVFEWCYKRIGEFIPTLVGEGNNPESCSITQDVYFMGFEKWRLTM